MAVGVSSRLLLLLRVGLFGQLLLFADAGQSPVRSARGGQQGLETAQIGTAGGVTAHSHAAAASSSRG